MALSMSCLHCYSESLTKEGYTDIVELLLAHGSDINFHDYERRTALIWAAKGGHIRIVRLLMVRGADISFQDCRGQTAQDYIRLNK